MGTAGEPDVTAEISSPGRIVNSFSAVEADPVIDERLIAVDFICTEDDRLIFILDRPASGICHTLFVCRTRNDRRLNNALAVIIDPHHLLSDADLNIRVTQTLIEIIESLINVIHVIAS